MPVDDDEIILNCHGNERAIQARNTGRSSPQGFAAGLVERTLQARKPKAKRP
jgi:hypothetical protein